MDRTCWPTVDVDDPTTWPPDVRRTVVDAADLIHDPDNTTDLEPGDEARQRIAEALDGCRVLVHHATRLHPHEVAMVREQGLRTLDDDLIREKLDACVTHGLLSPIARDELWAQRAPLDDDMAVRAGMVWATSSRASISEQNSGARALLQNWGGEATYWRHERSGRLRGFGDPMVVSFTIDAVEDRAHRWSPGLANALLGTHLRLPDSTSDVRILHPIVSGDIVDIAAPSALPS